MSLPGAAERAAGWLAPLPGASPFGTDVRHEPEHEAIRAEVAKLDSPASAAQINWKKVADGGTALLSSRSKDFLIAAYTAHALHEQESLSGLLAGLLLLNGLLDAAWDGMFPPPARIKGRIAALQWFVDRAGARLAGNGAGSHEAADLDALDAALQRLAELTRARFAADAPALQGLTGALQRLRTGGPAISTPTVAPSASESESVSESVSVSASAATPTAEESPTAQHARLVEAVAAWLEPISADEKAGKDARYDPLHEEVRAMIKQLDSPIGGAVEWKKLVSRTETLLKQRSKDLLICCYAAYGMYQQTGLSGLADGIALIAGLLERYWDELFPDMKRSHKARAGALSWLLPRLLSVGERTLSPLDAPIVARLAEAARWFADEVTTRFDYDHRPALRPFLEQVERLELAVQTPAPATPQPEAAAARAGASAATTAAPNNSASAQPTTVAVPQNIAAPGGAANRDEVTRYLATLRSALNDMGKALRAANPQDPLAYLLPRAGAALELDEVPPSQNGRTFIPAISALELQELKSLQSEKSWDALLSGAEGAAANRPLSFDLQRMVHTALRQLGAGYDACRLVVEAELAALLRRLPGVLDLSHGNGTSFADADTQAWIRAEIMTGADGGAAAPAGSSDELDTEALAAARALALAGSTGEALVAFDGVLHAARSGRARFAIRLAMARAVLAAGDAQLASGLFSALYDEIERRGLDEWEPELAADCLAGYHDCLSRGLAKNPEMAQRSAVVYARLCRVDPRRALKASQ